MAFFGSHSDACGGGWVEDLPKRSTPRARTPPTNSWRSSYQYVTATPHPNMLGPSGHFVPLAIQPQWDPNSGLDVYGNPLDGSGTLPISHGNEGQQRIEVQRVLTGGRYPQQTHFYGSLKSKQGIPMIPINNGDAAQQGIKDPGASTGGLYPQQRDTKITPSQAAHSQQKKSNNWLPEHAFRKNTAWVNRTSSSPKLRDSRRDVKGKSVLHTTGVACADEGARVSNLSQPSSMTTANSPPEPSFYSTSESRHGREVEETTYNRMTEMPNIARASTPELNYYEPDDLYVHEFANPNYALSHPELWGQNPAPNIQGHDGSPERIISQTSSSKISKESPVFSRRSHSPGVFRTSDYMSYKALDPPSQPVMGEPSGGKAPSQKIALNSEGSTKYQFNDYGTELGRGVLAATADISESIHDHPGDPNEEGDALSNPPEGGLGISHPDLKRGGAKGLSISRWGLRRKNRSDVPVGNGERKIGFRQRIRNMFQHKFHV